MTFTGESRTGAAIMQRGRFPVKPVSFEFGGKNAAIVFADCDFEQTHQWAGGRRVHEYRPSLPLRRATVMSNAASSTAL